MKNKGFRSATIMGSIAGLSLLFLTTICVNLAASALGQGTILWDESLNGQISGDFGNPTAFGTLQNGTNSVLAAVSVTRNGNTWVGQDDYFTFQVPANLSLAAIFVAVDRTSVWAWSGDPTFSDQLGFVPSVLNGDLIQQWSIQSIGAGTYGMYLENHDHSVDSSIASYRLDFFTEPIPEPSTFALLSAGAVALAVWRRKKRA